MIPLNPLPKLSIACSIPMSDGGKVKESSHNATTSGPIPTGNPLQRYYSISSTVSMSTTATKVHQKDAVDDAEVQPQEQTHGADNQSVCLSRRLFVFGFIFPLLWFIGAIIWLKNRNESDYKSRLFGKWCAQASLGLVVVVAAIVLVAFHAQNAKPV